MSEQPVPGAMPPVPPAVPPTGPPAGPPTATGTHVGPAPTGPAGTHEQADGRSLGELVGDIADDLTTLVKQEVELAKKELKTEATKAGKGVGLLGGGGVAGHFALFFLSFALLFLLDSWMHAAWAALIVGVLWAIAAAVMAMAGRKELKSVNPKLENTQRTLKEDAQWATELKNS